jgi:hypothetical protein
MRALIRRLRNSQNGQPTRFVFGVLASTLEEGVRELHTALDINGEVEALRKINATIVRAHAEYLRLGEVSPVKIAQPPPEATPV